MLPDDRPNTFTTSAGKLVQLKPVSQFKFDTMRGTKVELPKPTYETTLAGGEKFNLTIEDEQTAKEQDKLDEWNKYLQAQQVCNNEFGTRFNEFMILDGIDIEVPDKESEWQKQCDALKIVVPEDSIKRKVFYVVNEILGTPLDLGDLVAAIMKASKFDEEVIKKIKDSFRAAMERKADKRMAKRRDRVENK